MTYHILSQVRFFGQALSVFSHEFTLQLYLVGIIAVLIIFLLFVTTQRRKVKRFINRLTKD